MRLGDPHGHEADAEAGHDGVDRKIGMLAREGQLGFGRQLAKPARGEVARRLGPDQGVLAQRLGPRKSLLFAEVAGAIAAGFATSLIEPKALVLYGAKGAEREEPDPRRARIGSSSPRSPATAQGRTWR